MILSRLIGFIMIPIYTRVLTPSDYGVLEILSLTTDILAMLAGMGIGVSVVRQYSLATTDADRHGLVSSAATLLLVLYSMVTGLGLVLASRVTPFLLGDGNSAGLFRLAVIMLSTGGMLDVPLAVMRARQMSGSVVAASLARLLLSLLLNILLVVVMKLGVAGILYSGIASSLAVGGFLTFQIYRTSGFHFRIDLLRRLVSFGGPLAVLALASFVMHFSDRYFIRMYGTLQDVGLYSLGYKLAMLSSLLVLSPFYDIWLPKAMEIDRVEGDGAPKILASILESYNIVLTTVVFGVSLFSYDFIRVMASREFYSAADPVPLLALGMLFFGYRNISQIGSFVRGRSDLIAIATVFAAALVTALNLLLIPRWGIRGAALSTTLAFAAEFFVTRRLSFTIYPLLVSLRVLLFPVGIAVAIWLALAALQPPELGILPSIVLRMLAFGGFLGVLRARGMIPAELESAAVAAMGRVRGRLALGG